MKAYAIQRPDGSVIVDSTADSESWAWMTARNTEGYSIAWLKSNGYTAVEVEITVVPGMKRSKRLQKRFEAARAVCTASLQAYGTEAWEDATRVFTLLAAGTHVICRAEVVAYAEERPPLSFRGGIPEARRRVALYAQEEGNG